MLHLGLAVRPGLPGAAAWLVAGLAIVGIAGRVSARPAIPEQAKPSSQNLTFNRDIAPIVFHSCANCHQPDEAAPFSLLTYADVKKHARQIAEVTRSRNMPPWLPETQPLKFADEMRLTDAEITLIQRWVEQGAVEGNPADLPAAPKLVAGWRLGKPDMILTAS